MLTECMDCNKEWIMYILIKGYLDQTAEELNIIKILTLWLGNLMRLTQFREENAS